MRRSSKHSKGKAKAARAVPRKSRANGGRLADVLEQQAATSEILRVIRQSPNDTQPVFDAIVRSAARLCEAEFSAVARLEDGLLHLAAISNMSPAETAAYHSLFPRPPRRDFVIGRAFVEGRPVHVEDVLTDPDYDPHTLEVLQRAATYRSYLGVPIVRNGVPIGAIGCGRHEVKPFTRTQVELVKTFADQAVIAIENARLFQELESRNHDLTASLEQQTATGEILRVISSSPTDIQPVFDIIAESAVRLCAAEVSAVTRFDGEWVHLDAVHGSNPAGLDALRRAFPMRPGGSGGAARAIHERAIVHISDVLTDRQYRIQDAAIAAGFRALLGVPMLRDGRAIGAITVGRSAAGRFSDAQVRLLGTFAEQAIIAIENVRLFTELEARNAQLTESLEQQTATAEILGAISSSPTDIRPVLGAVVRAAARFCGAPDVAILRLDQGVLRGAAAVGPFGDVLIARSGGIEALELPLTRGSVSGRSVLERRTVHVHDLAAEPEGEFPVGRDLQRRFGHRTTLSTPLLREGVPLGAIVLFRTEAQPFSDRQLELVKTFADQAVIAIENVRLFNELETRNRDLTEALEQQTATGEILRVISSSPTDVEPVLDALVKSATRFCGAYDAVIFLREGDSLRVAAHHGPIPQTVGRERPLTSGTVVGRSLLERRAIHVADLQAEAQEFPEGSAFARRLGHRTILSVPLVSGSAGVGVIQLRRAEVNPFSDKQVALLQTFADQAVIAIENVRLFKELEARNHDLTESLEQQTATSEILRVISSSPTDAQPVFDIIGERAEQLCDAAISMVSRLEGELIHLVSLHGVTGEGAAAIRDAFPMRIDEETGSARAVRTRAAAHVPDVLSDPLYVNKAAARTGGYRAVLAVPMVREDQVIGVILVARTRPGPFTDSQVDLLKTFADQAVIAIENVRLFTELGKRNRDLTDALEQQTATSEVLRVISASPGEVQPVFDAIVRSAVRLCHARFALVYRLEGDLIQFAAQHNLPPDAVDQFQRTFPQRLSESPTLVARAILRGQAVDVADIAADSQVSESVRELARSSGYRSVLAVPIMREGRPLGAIAITRSGPGGEPQPFSSDEIPLLQTFTDQAAIAIDNGHLFKELEARTAQLTRSVGELRALGEVSQAVSSTLDLDAVLAAIVSRAVQLSGSDQGVVYEFDEATQTFHQRATHRMTREYLEAMRQAPPIRLGEGTVGRAGVTREPVQVGDLQEEWELVAPQARELLARQGMRSLLSLPLVRENRLLGGLVVIRRERGAFSPEVVATLQTLATQSVVAIYNARLFREIQRQKQYSDALVETSPVAIVTMDLAGTVMGWNPGAERLFGYPPAEALGRRMEDLIATPDLREEVRANIRQTLEGEWIRAMAQRARKDGTLVDVEISSMPVVVDGARVGMIGIYHDITELLRARREAEAANEAKGAFLATMSHEIRTPMNAVIGMSGLLLNTALTDEQREYAEVVRQSGDALLTVINDILDFSKIEAGRLELEAQPFDLRECVEGALDLVATRAAEKGLDLAYLIGDGTPSAVVGDVTRLRQVLLNLLSNAVKFTEAGEVVLSVNAQRPDEPGRPYELTFSVRDTGIGIPLDRLGRLFQSFSQVDASTTRRYGGTGLGLAISQRLTELMGGRIEVTSEVGRGSEFRFAIRARAAEAPLPARRDLSGVQPSLEGKRVLVVDDNATNRRILTSHLGIWGLPARATESPREALGWIRADERFDVAILDMHMPEMDGAALAHAIREHPSGATLPLVLFTSLGRREAAAESAGFAAYLHKPIKPSQLFDTLVSVLAEQPVRVAPRTAGRGELDPGMAARHPLRILLAEDNVVNQKLALRLLGQMGYRADLAGNGLEAVDAVARQTYDVVLMDVQMPEMDGLEASREINQRWPDGRRPRIVAMTANAMQGDRELCTAAGMDDYVAKPIRVEELVGALERCRPRREGPARGAKGDGAGTPAAAPEGEIDRATLERLVETMGGAFVAELIDTFGQDAGELIATLRRALAEADLDAFRRAAHSLKSTSESLGASELAARARELEAAARAGSLDGAGDRLQDLVDRYELVTRALGAYRRGLPA